MNAEQAEPARVYLEVTSPRTFAMALDWPGWGRSGKTADAALEALADYAPRYAAAAGKAGIDFPVAAGGEFAVVERLDGNSTTKFGAPAVFAAGDFGPWRGDEPSRCVRLLQGCWEVFEETAARSPAALTKGPRGGGRDRDQMIAHVLGAEAAYARKIGVKARQPPVGDTAAINAMRANIVAVLGADSGGEAPTPNGWPPRYAVRRLAWHVLDHAFEMQDRSGAAT